MGTISMRIFIFESTRSVIRAEGVCRAVGLEVRVIPVPRSISPKCGMALEVENEYEKEVRRVLEENNLPAETFNRKDVTL
jgi:hypothetical protein